MIKDAYIFISGLCIGLVVCFVCYKPYLDKQYNDQVWRFIIKNIMCIPTGSPLNQPKLTDTLGMNSKFEY